MFVIRKQWARTVLGVVLFFLTIGTEVFASHTSTTTKTKTSKYDIAIPVLFGVTISDLTPNFGEPRGGGTRSHEGLDIMAPEGTPIVSPVKATVVKFGTAGNPGKYVYTKGSDGHMYWYMHLDEIAKLKRGQKLKVGDLIGTVGETGNAKGTTPHLHFEIRKNKVIDPYTRIKKEFTLEEKIAFLNASLADLKKDEKVIALVTERFRGMLMLAEAEGLKLDTEFMKALKKQKSGLSLGSTTVGLREGDDGEGVRALQEALIRANMGTEAYRLAQAGATGYFGRLTKNALIEFQKSFGLPADGVFGQGVKTALQGTALGTLRGDVKGIATSTLAIASSLIDVSRIVSTELARGQSGVEVSLLQTYLILYGDGPVSKKLEAEGPTGYFGVLTESALREYQAEQGLVATGIFDALTREYITQKSINS
jgi:peptidoglycan hydrolase-like protein with peptidoglycan-binding domain